MQLPKRRIDLIYGIAKSDCRFSPYVSKNFKSSPSDVAKHFSALQAQFALYSIRLHIFEFQSNPTKIVDVPF